MEISVFNGQKKEEPFYMEKSRNNVQIMKESVYMETPRDNDHKKAYMRNLLQLQYHSSPFILEKQINSFSYQCTISTIKTHGLRHYCFHGQANLYRLCRLWKMSRRQNWAIFLVQKRLRLLGCKKKFSRTMTKDINESDRLEKKRCHCYQFLN